MTTSLDWAVVLAGGDGTRLQPFTSILTGDERPKQFCRLLARHTLLGATRARLCHLVAPERTLYVVNAQHRPFYREDLSDVRPHQVIEQPSNRGTGAAVIYALAKLKRLDPGAVVGFFPADHHFDDVSMFQKVIAGAFWAARQDPTRIVMVGTVPTHPEPDYGWIVRGDWQPRQSVAANFPVYAVDAFVEKPRETQALSLMANGGLWNTFVLIGRLRTFQSLIAGASPGLSLGFSPLMGSVGLASEAASAAAVYAATTPVDFSADVLALQPERLSVIEAPAMGWTDLGRADRVLALRDRLHPPRLQAS